MDLHLQGKTALVTGGSKGIGRAIVEGLLAEGAQVVNVNREGPEGRELAEQSGGACLFVPADLVDIDACQAAVQTAVAHFGGLDILINNAGVNDSVSLSAGVGAFCDSLAKNLVHVYAMAHFALEELKRRRGAIINIGSKVSVTGQGGTSGYAAAKGGVNSLTREWAAELAPHGVRVNAVLPAESWTPLYEKCLASEADPAAAKAAISNLIPLGGRFTSVQELADTVLFLASERSSHTTGQILFVDGGYTHLDRKLTATL
ncbi:L-fucose dehydrogenase [Lignipirellula cremea]|uniref:3-oxoacyl-[acyl-carrier-protein] reductase FabG n=1 Tax=Lignipirellula cremea TaxID=2528010 RepID=A0A518E084_9BACT|nr:SDR family oxidoreductase [Lignipirellula cremea]QDU97495.1 3-oxoacyl-[acyl-carrier-protein] reductase FabG [Lignipirellula cremea]